MGLQRRSPPVFRSDGGCISGRHLRFLTQRYICSAAGHAATENNQLSMTLL